MMTEKVCFFDTTVKFHESRESKLKIIAEDSDFYHRVENASAEVTGDCVELTDEDGTRSIELKTV